MSKMSLMEANKAYTELMTAVEELAESFKQYKENVKETLRLLPGAVLPCDTEEATKEAAWDLYWNCPKIPARTIADALGLIKGLGLPAYIGPAYFETTCCICRENRIQVKKNSRTGSIEGKYTPCESCREKQEQNRREVERWEQEAAARCKVETDGMTPEEAKAMPYSEYLETQHWQNTRKRALRKAGYKCQLDNKVGLLHVHHKTYENIGCEHDDDLIVLCDECHARHHGKEIA